MFSHVIHVKGESRCVETGKRKADHDSGRSSVVVSHSFAETKGLARIRDSQSRCWSSQKSSRLLAQGNAGLYRG